MSKLIWFLIVSIFFSSSVFSAEVGANIHFSEDTAFFSYVFKFSEDENYNSFSFEKPRDAILISALDQENNFIKTSVAGDYFIIYPEDTANSTIKIDFESKSSYSNINVNNVFSSYFIFNFDVTSLSIKLDVTEIEKEIISVNPRDYSIIEQGVISFDRVNLDQETFVQVEFSASDVEVSNPLGEYFYIILSLLLLIMLFAVFFLRGYLKNFKKNKNSSTSEMVVETNKETTSDSIDVTVGSREKNNEEDEVQKENEFISIEENNESQRVVFEEYLNKYLTDNEKEVVLVVKDVNGIAQNEILHHLPSLTKSNLSKIITKLHGKHILSRIRVGKINKIYIGDKLNFEEKPETENK